jgi:hypothetical protein
VTIRELLQIEIWSKKTSRKLLIGFGIAFVVVGIGFVEWYAINRYWITPGERTAGRAALAQIDALQNFNRMSDAEYDAGALQAKRKIDAALEAAWTSRDKWIVAELGGYFILTDTDRSDRKMKEKLKSRHIDPKLERLETEQWRMSIVMHNITWMQLHMALD